MCTVSSKLKDLPPSSSAGKLIEFNAQVFSHLSNVENKSLQMLQKHTATVNTTI